MSLNYPKTKKTRKKLKSTSSTFFFTGSLFSKLSYFPVALFATFCNLISLLFYLLAYVVWFLESLLHPSHPHNKKSWSSFAQFKKQLQAAAILGTIATILFIAFPHLVVPAAWIFVVSNVMWSLGEYNKQKNPPQDEENYSSLKQADYTRYVYLSTLIRTLTATAVTIAWFVPAIGLTTIILAAFTSICISIGAFYYLLKSIFDTYPHDRGNHSYYEIIHMIGDVEMKEIKSRPNIPLPTLTHTSELWQTPSVPAPTLTTPEAPKLDLFSVPNS